jgi:hypothetical protein
LKQELDFINQALKKAREEIDIAIMMERVQVNSMKIQATGVLEGM